MRTLFVSGLPMDAKPRELYLLFRAYDGYENSQLKVTSKNGKTTSVTCCLFVFFLKKNVVNAIDLISAGGICDVCYTSQRRRSQAGFAGNNKCIEKHHLFIINGKRGHCFLVGTNRPTHAHTLGRVGGGKQSDAYIN